MKLALSEPVAADAGHVFAALSDFDAMTARLTGGALHLVRRADDAHAVPDGGVPDLIWDAELHLGGIARTGIARLADLRPGEGYVVEARFEAASATLAVDVVAERTAACRIDAAVDVLPRGIAGRLLLQPLRLMRETIRDRLAARLAQFAREVEAAQGSDPGCAR